MPFNCLLSNQRSKLSKHSVYRKNGTGEDIVDEMVKIDFFYAKHL